MITDGYTTDDITYLWKVVDPVQIAKGLSLPRFSIEKYSSSYCNVKTNTGEIGTKIRPQKIPRERELRPFSTEHFRTIITKPFTMLTSLRASVATESFVSNNHFEWISSKPRVSTVLTIKSGQL